LTIYVAYAIFIIKIIDEVKKMKTNEIKKEYERENREADMEKLIHLSYDRLADGGRNRNRSPRRIDPETVEAIRRIWA
jgi:hypothetical protein